MLRMISRDTFTDIVSFVILHCDSFNQSWILIDSTLFIRMIFKLFVVFHMVMVCRCQLFTAPMINNQHVPLSALINVTSIGEEIVRSIEKPIKDLIMSTVKSQIEFHLDEFRAKDLKLLQESNEQNENETKEIRKMIEKLTASVLKSKNQPTSENPLPSDCVYIDRLNGSGIYYVIPEGSFESFKVFCDMETDGGGWTVFQRRMDGSEDFYRGWGDYEKGFGNLEKEFWLGNSILHTLTSQGKYELRIDLEDFENNKRYAKYTSFSVGGKETNYRLTFGSYSGDAGDSLVHHNGSAFSTKDNDNDGSGTNCAKTYKGGWWYKICHTSNLNGRYLKGKHSSFADGINWLAWKGYHFSLKTTTMMVRKVK